jgi:Ni/Co efflux regulator RcnB
MKKILLATIIAVTVAAGPSHAQQTTTKDQLIGSWKVLNLKATTGNKVTYPPRGAGGGLRYPHPHAVLAVVRGCDPKSTNHTDADRC